jgi:3-isopropylmalate/(R)-2-methylmalate dehydratase small subunit
MTMSSRAGRAWIFGDRIDTDVLAPGHLMKLSAEDLACHCLQAIAPNFAAEVRPGDIIVAGSSFGIGSSREQAAVSLKLLGVRAILATSFARIFWRNALNLGLPALTMSDVAGIKQGDLVKVDPASGLIENVTSGRTYRVQPLPPHLLTIVEEGGLMPFLKSRYGRAANAAT